MSAPNFTCTEHTVLGQHIRHYLRSTSLSQEDKIHLAVKQYTPRSSLSPQSGDVTILACHASGFPKELYEPFWDDLLAYSKRTGSFRIRNIWVADVFNQGASGVLNEHKLGNEPSWFDHARDYLSIVNHFRDQMPRPIIGFGHSMGGVTMINLALIHPRLLTSIITVEAILNKTTEGMHFGGVYGITFKKDKWPTIEAATKSINKSPFYRNWDPRIREIYIQYGFRQLPTKHHPEENTSAVTTTTTKSQEVLSFARAAYPPKQRDLPLDEWQPDPKSHPDLGDWRDKSNAFYRPESLITFAQLPHLRPSVLYIHGSKSPMASSQPKGRKDLLDVTGTGVGGSGGAAKSMVSEAIVPGGSHLPVMEQPTWMVEEIVGPRISEEMKRWEETEREEVKEWEAWEEHKRGQVDPDWEWWMKNRHSPRGPKNTTPENSKKESKL